MINPILNKGGMGVSITRRETIERLNPLTRDLLSLVRLYNALQSVTTDPRRTERLEALLRRARIDHAKLSETVLSAGGVPVSGVDMEPIVRDTPATNEDWRHILDQETAFADSLDSDLKDVVHHIRTLAILQNVRANSGERVTFLKGLVGEAQPAPVQ